jgi:hypothetical protein
MHLSVKPDQKIDIHLLNVNAEVGTGLVTVTCSSGTRALVEDQVNRAGM